MSSSSKAAKRQSPMSNVDKQVEVGGNRGTEEDEVAEYEKEESVFVTSQLSINGRNLDKEVVLRRIRQRKRMNKVRAAVGSVLGSTNKRRTGDAPVVQHTKWVDDAFAAL